MPYIAFWMHHHSRQREQLRRLATLLCAPVLSGLTRTAMIDRDKRVGGKAKSVAAVEAQLTAERSQGVDLDDAAAFFVFDDDDSESAYPAPHWGYITAPYDPSRRDEYLAVFEQLFCEFSGVLGYISVEPSVDEAQAVCLGEDTRETRSRSDMSEQRRRERKAQPLSKRDYPTRLPAVHWGTFLSAGHLDVVGLDALRAAPEFARVVHLRDELVLAQLSEEPMDALESGYEDALAAARTVLAPLLVDVTDIELKPAREAPVDPSDDA
ncbi:MAG: hypothetical protein AAGC55_07910 [Myxococcota bacterium]